MEVDGFVLLTKDEAEREYYHLKSANYWTFRMSGTATREAAIQAIAYEPCEPEINSKIAYGRIDGTPCSIEWWKSDGIIHVDLHGLIDRPEFEELCSVVETMLGFLARFAFSLSSIDLPREANSMLFNYYEANDDGFVTELRQACKMVEACFVR